MVLSLSGNSGLADSEPVWGSFNADWESGEFNQVWASLLNFERWHQEQHQIYSIELMLSRTCDRVSYLWKQFYKCRWEGTGGEKHYEKKGPGQSQKISSTQTVLRFTLGPARTAYLPVMTTARIYIISHGLTIRWHSHMYDTDSFLGSLY